jgi:hypothetical protein
MPSCGYLFIALAKNFVEPLAAAEHRVLTYEQLGFQPDPGVDQLCANVTTANVFIECIGGLVDNQLI